MGFDWMQANRSNRTSGAAERRRAMYRDELTERAALLRRLGFSKNATAARLRANVAWDFEVGAHDPPSNSEIDQIVAAVYKR